MKNEQINRKNKQTVKRKVFVGRECAVEGKSL